MKTRILALSVAIVILFTSCGRTISTAKPSTPTAQIPLRPTAKSTILPVVDPTALPLESPTNTPDLNHLEASTILFEQNFEAGNADGLSAQSEYWKIVPDDTGNHAYCNIPGNYYLVVPFGDNLWTNYAIELRVKDLEHHEDPYVSVYARYTPDTNIGYYGALNFLTEIADLAMTNPYLSIDHQIVPTEIGTWYTLRLEVAGSHIKFFINNQLVGNGTDYQLTRGRAGFSVSPDLSVCVDDIRAWALTDNGAIGTALIPNTSKVEIVTDKAATGDGGNAWGGHQTRIVHTQDGVFTAFTIDGGGYSDKKWQLARRQEDGTWPVIAEGDAGREPVNLLASPDGTLHVVGWPGGFGTMWSGKPEGNQISMNEERVPGVAEGNWPYNSAGIDGNGDLCVLSSAGGEPPGGSFMWACLLQSKGQWISHTSQLDYRYCYTYVFPLQGGQLALVSTRDVRWGALGYVQPAGEFDYVFNALGYWRTDDITKDPLQRDFFLEEKPTYAFPDPYLDAQLDAYLDIVGNMHIIYREKGSSTQGTSEMRQVILSSSGKVLKNVQLRMELGDYARIFQDTEGRFYILGSSGLLYPAGKDGVTLGIPIKIDLSGYTVEYSGYGISVPRTGSPLSNILDVVFPSDYGAKWIYFQLPLPEN